MDHIGWEHDSLIESNKLKLETEINYIYIYIYISIIFKHFCSYGIHLLIGSQADYCNISL
jgi:hypothetical protein